MYTILDKTKCQTTKVHTALEVKPKPLDSKSVVLTEEPLQESVISIIEPALLTADTVNVRDIFLFLIVSNLKVLAGLTLKVKVSPELTLDTL